MGTCYIKIREKGKKTWKFLTRNGSTRLRIYASTFATREKAQALIDANATDNPEWDWKVVS